MVNTTVFKFCVGCSEKFEVSSRVQSSRVRCDTCQCNHQRELNRARVARSRARSRKPTSLGEDTKEALKEYQLRCGHTILFTIPPEDGQDIYCYRCQGCIEYDTGKRYPLCPELHRMTPYNTGRNPDGEFCLRCEEPESLRRHPHQQVGRRVGSKMNRRISL